ncbi:MAG: oligoendopeptidase F [Acidimicrobiia bacterium]|nr:oligoendopeptidase F [Acidimicrobiia bacterium]
MSTIENESLPRWSVADVHESLDSRSFRDAMELMTAETSRLETTFDELGIRALPEGATPNVDAETGRRTDRAISEFNALVARTEILEAYVYATVATNTRDETAQALLSEIEVVGSRISPLLARLADFVCDHDVDALCAVSAEARDHAGPLQRLAERSAHQMSEELEGLYAELSTTGTSAWGRLQSDVTSQLTAEVRLPDGAQRLPMPAVRGLANANSVSRATFDAMQSAITASLPDFRAWMKVKASLHGHTGALPWWDLMAPLPVADNAISWEDSVSLVRDAFGSYSANLAGLVDRAITESWMDVPPREGKVGGAFCMPFVDDRSLVLLNWSGSVESAQTTAHELGHAYHNTQLAGRTPLQKRLPMALAETASIFCETLVVEAGLKRLSGAERLALLDVDLQGANQVVVDIHSRFLFETEVFARRQRRTLGVNELNEIMLQAQLDAYGEGLDQSTAHPHMWVLKPHYYGSHFYNWPYTYGLLFGLGLFAQYHRDPGRFRAGYDDLLGRAGMNTAEELGSAFGIDVTSEAFWTASLDVLRARMTEYTELSKSL